MPTSAARILVSTKDMQRDEWLKHRMAGIGGSDVAAIAGLSKYKSPMTIYMEKTGEIEPEEVGEAAYWGTVLEDVVAREFAIRFEQDHGYKPDVRRRNAMFQSIEHPFMLANVDRLIMDKQRGRGILECKTASEYLLDAWEEERVPDAYMLQVQHYLYVTGLSFAYIAVLIGGNKFRYKLIERDDELIGYLIKIEAGFWKMVEDRTPPLVDGSESSATLLSKLYPEEDPESIIVLPETAEPWFQYLDQAKADKKAAEERENEAKNQLKALMGNAAVGSYGDRKITWKTVNRSGYTVEPKSYRDFRVR